MTKTKITMSSEVYYKTLKFERDKIRKEIIEKIDELLPKFYEDGADVFAGELKKQLEGEYD